MASSSGLSREFTALVRSIGESKSKGDEDTIITTELAKLKNVLCGRGPEVSSYQMKEYLLRMLYAEMLGHDASFGHIAAVKLCSSARNLSCKRVAYLAVSACLNPSSDLLLLLVNTLQMDLQSANQLEVQMALQLVCRLMSPDLVPPLIQPILKAASHMQASVRKKATVTLWRCYQIAPEVAIANEIPLRLKSMLCDKDPSVMGATLPALLELDNLKDVCPSVVSILKQIVEHRLARDYDYRRIPAPWIQIKLIQLIGKIATNDKIVSQSCYEVLHEVIKRADTGINIGYAVIYECIRTICAIYPNPGLLDEAAKQVSRFICSEYHNRKYLGIDALASLVKVEPRYALDHQLVVIDCLDSPDETLRRKTLDLLYRMTGSHNVTVIVDAMMKFITSPNSDQFLRKELVFRITSLAEKFAPDMIWFMEIFNQLLTIAGDFIPYPSINSVFKLLSSDSALDQREEIVARYAARLHEIARDTAGVTPVMVQVLAWILGEFADSEEDTTVVQDLCNVLPRVRQPMTQSYILAALMKLICRLKVRPVPRSVLEAADRYQRSVSVDLQQRCSELFAISQMDSEFILNVLPPQQSFNEVEVDPMLPFLDDFVASVLRKGAQPYNRPEIVAGPESNGAESHLKYTPYTTVSFPPFKLQEQESAPPASDPVHTDAIQQTTSGLKLTGVSRKWGPSGYGAAPATNANLSSNVSSAVPESSSIHPDRPAAPGSSAASNPAPVPKRSVADNSLREKEARAALFFGGANKSSASSSSATSAVSLPAARKMTAAARSTTRAPEIDDLLDMASLTGSLPTVSTASHPIVSVPKTNDPIADLLQSLDPALPPSTVPIKPISGKFQLPFYRICSEFENSTFAKLARSTEDDILLSQDGSICATAFTMFKHDATILALFVRNISSIPIFNLAVGVKSGSGVVSIHPCLGDGTDLTSVAMSAEFSLVNPDQVVAFLATLSVTSPVVNVALDLCYSGNILTLFQTIPIAHFIRPFKVITSQFGQMWLETRYTQNEKRLEPFLKRPDEMDAILSRMRIHLVQTINQESIASAKIGEHVILLHIRFDSSGSVYVTIRASSDQALSLGIGALRAEVQESK